MKMAARRADPVFANIIEELGQLSPVTSDRCIFKVPHQLRKINEQAYEPKTISIGPYHHDNDKLRPMEEHKLRYLQLLLHRRKETNADRYVISIKNSIERARRYYAEPVVLNDDEFVKIMLLDGCFIIELFRRRIYMNMRDRTDPIFKMTWLEGNLCIDLLLLENQLPFFVLEELFNMTKFSNEMNLIDSALAYFHEFCGTKHVEGVKSVFERDVRHLLGLIHYSRLPELPTMEQEAVLNLTRLISCATELREAGIKFKKVPEGCIFNLKFTNGVMEIPPLEIVDQTESFFRNLIAYEQHDRYQLHYYFTDYIALLDCLINSQKDVELLRKAGSISNWLGDDKVISNMFNKLGDNVVLLRDKFYYSRIFADVNTHCDKIWNRRRAMLMHNYFNSPWTGISVLAAVALLLLTITQTVFSVISYLK